MSLTQADIETIHDMIDHRPEVAQSAFKRYLQPTATAVGVLVLIVQLSAWGGKIDARMANVEKELAELKDELRVLRGGTLTRGR